MDRAEVLVGPGTLERKRKLLLCIKRLGFECVIDAQYGVRHIILVDPGHLRALGIVSSIGAKLKFSTLISRAAGFS
jgi:hypothetical protein